MYRDNRYTSSGAPSLPPPPRRGSKPDRHESFPGPAHPSAPRHHHPPPPPPPPPEPPRRWDDRPPPPPPDYDRNPNRNPNRNHDRDRYPQQDRRNDFAFRGSYPDQRSQPTNGAYRDRDRDRDYRDDFRPPQGEFSFRVERPPGVDAYRPASREFPPPVSYDAYRPDYRRDHRTYNRDRERERERDRDRNDSHRPRQREYHGSRGGGQNLHRNGGRPPPRQNGPSQRPIWKKYQKEKPSDRALLSRKHGDESELMLGDRSGRASYRDVDHLSDSDEADMDISDNNSESAAAVEPATKRARVSAPTIKVEAEDDIPRWSNPDPYTALPPPDETTRKKKDMVKFIRKSRVESESQKTSTPDEAVDYISCDVSGEEGEDDKTVSQPLRQSHANKKAAASVPNASKGPAITQHFHSLPPKPPAPPATTLPATTPGQTRSTQNQAPKPAKQGSQQKRVDLTPSTSLGSRKRTFDDDIKLPHVTLKKATKMSAQGHVMPDWQVESDEEPCPWVTVDHSATPCLPATRLHKELVDFYEYVRPREFEQEIRQQMVDRIEKLVQRLWLDTKIFAFGSFMSGLYLPNADMDLVVCSNSFVNKGIPKYDLKMHLKDLRRHFSYHKIAFLNKFETVFGAKVPLVKFTDAGTALKVDISFEKLDGYHAIQTFLKWKEMYPVMPMLVSIVKHFLLMRGLNEPVNGGIGGFSVICMVVNLLNQMPQVQSRSMIPEHHLGELLMEFLDYYGNKFQYTTVAIRMSPPGLVDKKQVQSLTYKNMNRLSIIDPNNPENDISGGSANTATIFNQFSMAFDVLKQRMGESASRDISTSSSIVDRTLLGSLFAGNYSHFRLQRDYLERLSVEGLPEYGFKNRSNEYVFW